MSDLMRFAAMALAIAGLALYGLAARDRLERARLETSTEGPQPILDRRRKIALGLTLAAIALHWAAGQMG